MKTVGQNSVEINSCRFSRPCFMTSGRYRFTRDSLEIADRHEESLTGTRAYSSGNCPGRIHASEHKLSQVPNQFRIREDFLLCHSRGLELHPSQHELAFSRRNPQADKLFAGFGVGRV